MDELRVGVKLRKTDNTKKNTEFSMTPYELLMNDIKSKKAVLKPPTKLPVHLEMAARDKIMEYIKSKPKLKPVSERKLADIVPTETPAEKLMSDIRSGKARQSLRRSKTRLKHSTLKQSLERVASVKDGKKVINIDDDLHSSLVNFDTSPENTDDEDNSNNNVFIDQPSPKPECKEVTLQEVSWIRSQFIKAEFDQQPLTSTEEREIQEGRICFQCRKIKFNWLNWAYSCQICKNMVCRSCCTKMKLPTKMLSEVSVSSLSSQLESSLADDQEKSSFDRISFARCSLRTTKSVNVEEEPRFTRSKTLSKTEARNAKTKLSSSTPGSSADCSVSVNGNCCLDCKTLLVSVLWGKKSPSRSPSHRKSIHDLQSKTINKKKLLKAI